MTNDTLALIPPSPHLPLPPLLRSHRLLKAGNQQAGNPDIDEDIGDVEDGKPNQAEVKEIYDLTENEAIDAVSQSARQNESIAPLLPATEGRPKPGQQQQSDADSQRQPAQPADSLIEKAEGRACIHDIGKVEYARDEGKGLGGIGERKGVDDPEFGQAIED